MNEIVHVLETRLILSMESIDGKYYVSKYLVKNSEVIKEYFQLFHYS